ncbi:6888_t:CDS:1, partial [Dentiscutata erythropus]
YYITNMVEHTCTRCGKNFPKLWKLRRYNERQYKCRPKVIPQITIPPKKYAPENHFRSIYEIEDE